MNIYRLSKTTMLPYCTVRGSVEQRNAKAIQLTNKFIKEITPAFAKENDVEFSRVQKILDRLLGKGKIKLIKNQDEMCLAYCDPDQYMTSSGKPFVKKFIIAMPYVENKIPFEAKNTLIHEFRHLTDSLFHPKIVYRTNILARISGEKENARITDIYEQYLDADIKSYGSVLAPLELKYAILQVKLALLGKSREKKISYLQYMRYHLMSEYNAYGIDCKYTDWYSGKYSHEKIRRESITKTNMYIEKIQMLNKMLAETISKERKSHAKKLNRKN